MCEDDDFNEYMENIYNVMLNAIDRGLNTTGLIPGKLEIKRKAHYIYHQKSKETDPSEIARRKVVAYAYAVAEENASGGEIVTSPTCGAAGVLPACLKYALDMNKYTHEEIINALKVAGLIGNLVKHNGSISGAEAGCQAEIGTACSMAATFLVSLKLTTFEHIESAAEIALEHHLGLTCDPIDGYVQIPCIERNAVAALRAIDAAKLSTYLNNSDSKISFDVVVKTMLQTGKDLHASYRETSEGGLAKHYK
jgi:L-serine dehydratase